MPLRMQPVRGETPTHSGSRNLPPRSPGPSESTSAGKTAGPGEGASPAVRLLNALLARAVEAGASDLHLEPDREGLRIRLRIDGHLDDFQPPPVSLVPALLTRVRLLAGVDLAERRLPQDGRFTWSMSAERALDVRASFLPTARGEKIALRLLQPGGEAPSIQGLGMNPADAGRLRRALARPSGLVLVVGPTGSGKSTTLHAALVHLCEATRSLASVEDPVEFDMPGVSQVAVDDNVGRSFAVVLRALLRQDPDVLMVGEIRDDESARIACRAALTGHLVLSSLHAAHAREALVRLPEIGVAEYLVRATVSLVIAQRLVRRLCPTCTRRCDVDLRAQHWFARAGFDVPRFLPRPQGCEVCRGRGYQGRLAVFELASGEVDAPEPFTPGSLGAEGLARVLEGQTSLEEVLSECPHPLDGSPSSSASAHSNASAVSSASVRSRP